MGAGASRPPAAGKRQAKKSNGSTPRRNASTGTLRSLQAAATIEAALDVCTRAVSAETSPLNIARALRHVAELWQAAEDEERDERLLHDARLRLLLQRALSAVPAMSLRSLSNSCWALATLGEQHFGLPFLARAEEATLRRLDECDPRDLANLVWAAATLGHSPSTAWVERLVAAWEQRLEEVAEWDAEASAAARRRPPASLSRVHFPRVAAQEPALAPRACRCAAQGEGFAEALPGLHPTSLERTLWALATLGHRPSDAWLDRFSAAAQRGFAAMDAQGLANVIWALASLSHTPDLPFLDSYAEASRARLGEFDEATLATTLWAFATINRHPGDAWLDAFAEVTLPRLGEFSAASLATTLWAYATLGQSPSADWMERYADAWINLFDDVWRVRFEERAGAKEPPAPQALENVLWAMATLKHAPGEHWLELFTEHALSRMGEFDPQGLGTLLWSYATLQHNPGAVWVSRYSDAWLAALAAAEGGGFAAVAAQSLSNSLWAFATLGVPPSDALLERLSSVLAAKLHDMDAHNLSNTLWGCASLGFSPGEPFLKAFADATARKMGEFTPHALANVLWSLATVGHSPGKAWLERFGLVAARRLPEFHPLSLSNLLWALVVLREHACGIKRPAALQALQALLARADAGELPDSVLFGLFQADLLLEAEAPELKARLPALDKAAARARAAWLHRARAVWLHNVRQAQQAHSGSAVLREVSKVLQAMGVRHSLCQLAEGGLVCIDIALLDAANDPNSKLAMYVDGPAHFVRNTHEPNGSTMLRNRLLEAYGWRVITVPQWQWPRATDGRVAYIKRLLATCG